MTRSRSILGTLLVLIAPVFAPLGIVAPNDFASFEGVIVDSIVIDNRNIYDTDSDQYRHFIYKLANRLHYKTRRWVVNREVLLKAGDPFSGELAQETARNLRQRLPLYDAWIETEVLPNDHLLVRVVTIDVWSLSGGLDLIRDGNETRYRLFAAERNLLGRNQDLSVDLVVDPDEQDYLVARFGDRRFFGIPLAVDAGYGDDPLSKFRTFNIGRPYYNLKQVWSYSLSVSETGGRREIYTASRLVGTSENKGDQFGVGAAWRVGSYYRKLQVSVDYAYIYEKTFDTTNSGTTVEERHLASAGFPSDSLYHRFGTAVRLSNLDFVTMRRIDGFGYTEDFTLGQAVQFGTSRAFTRDFRDHVFDVLDISLSFAYHKKPSLGLISYQRVLWFRDDRDLRRTAALLVNHYLRPVRFLTIATHGQYISDSRANGAEPLTVGSGDMRGFDDVFRTGDRKGVLSFESRFYPGIEVLTVGFSPVLFVDLARSWQRDQAFAVKDFYASAGVGLRLAIARSSRTRLVRIDAAYSERNGWQLSIGTGQYFQARQASLLLTSP